MRLSYYTCNITFFEAVFTPLGNIFTSLLLSAMKFAASLGKSMFSLAIMEPVKQLKITVDSRRMIEKNVEYIHGIFEENY
jgi:hypothetical protein